MASIYISLNLVVNERHCILARNHWLTSRKGPIQVFPVLNAYTSPTVSSPCIYA